MQFTHARIAGYIAHHHMMLTLKQRLYFLIAVIAVRCWSWEKQSENKKVAEMSVKTMSDEAVNIDYCSVCLKTLPPVKCFSRVCEECRKKIERGQIDELLRGLK